jgi:hypothetical protein
VKALIEDAVGLSGGFHEPIAPHLLPLSVALDAIAELETDVEGVR